MTSSRNPVDPRYVQARRVLLDVLGELSEHSSAIIITGAQAVYLRTGETDLAVAPYTTDGDLAVDPRLLSDEPTLELAMTRAGLSLKGLSTGQVQPGTWVVKVQFGEVDGDVPIDLLVPQALVSGKSRGANLGVHGRRAARTVPGIEAVLLDHSVMHVTALEPDDQRSVEVNVAGPTALLLAKAHKIADRYESGKPHRLVDKDASDVVRLMQTSDPTLVAQTLHRLTRDEVAGASATRGLQLLSELFGRRGRVGITMATRALEFALPSAAIEVLCVSYLERMTTALSELNAGLFHDQ